MMQTSSSSQRAWLLTFSAEFKAAVAYHEMSQILISPLTFRLSPAPAYCCDLIIVQNQILPLMNFDYLLKGYGNNSPSTVGIMRHQKKAKAKIETAAVYLQKPPESVEVSDAQACDLPTTGERGYTPHWAELALSCFLRQGQKIPILDVAYLFSLAFRQRLLNG
jgi:hypothetical protein